MSADRACPGTVRLQHAVTSTSTTTRPGSWPDEPSADVSTLARPGQPSAAEVERRIWRRSLFVGLSALVVSRMCMLIGAGVRASQQSVDADRLLEPRPGSPWRSWPGCSPSGTRTGTWRSSATGIPARSRRTSRTSSSSAGSVLPALSVRRSLARAIAPAGDTFAALLNVFAAIAAVVLVGLLARRLYGAEVAGRTMVLFAVFPGSFVLSFAAEALLIVLSAACLLFLIDERWLLAGVAAALATATRPTASPSSQPASSRRPSPSIAAGTGGR